MRLPAECVQTPPIQFPPYLSCAHRYFSINACNAVCPGHSVLERQLRQRLSTSSPPRACQHRLVDEQESLAISPRADTRARGHTRHRGSSDLTVLESAEAHGAPVVHLHRLHRVSLAGMVLSTQRNEIGRGDLHLVLAGERVNSSWSLHDR